MHIYRINNKNIQKIPTSQRCNPPIHPSSPPINSSAPTQLESTQTLPAKLNISSIYQPFISSHSDSKVEKYKQFANRATKRPPSMLIAVSSPEQRLLSHVCVRNDSRPKRKKLSTSATAI